MAEHESGVQSGNQTRNEEGEASGDFTDPILSAYDHIHQLVDVSAEMYICTFLRVYTHACMHMYAHTYIACVCLYDYLCARANAYLYHACVYRCMYVSTFVYIIIQVYSS